MTGTERKVFQKYYPPDFDPSKIPRAKGQRNRQFVQRVMAPYNMQCNTCHEYIYKGKKFNMRRETAEGETYLGLKIFRFYFRCPNCLAEITFKTDLENCDYQQEHGATRLFEAFKLYQQEEKAKETKEEEEKKDPMKMLEKRTKMSRTEMEALGKLEELQETNRRHEAFGPDQYFQNVAEAQAEALRRQEEKDEEFVRKLYGRTEDGKIIKRIVDDEEDTEMDLATKIRQKLEEDEQKPGCSSADQKPSFSAANRKMKDANESIGAVGTSSKRTSQREFLAKIVAVKKPKSEPVVVKTEPMLVKTEPPDPIEDGPPDTPINADLAKIPGELNGKQLSASTIATSATTAVASSALTNLADYGSDSSSN